MLSATRIKKYAEDAGFDLCGVTPCLHLDQQESHFRRWLDRGFHAGLGYLEKNLDKRFDVRRLVDGAQSVVVCAVGYKNRIGEGYPDGFRGKIASYACAEDYHVTIKRMLGRVFDALVADSPSLRGRAFVDTAPLLEKHLAVRAGLGWVGRQSLLVTPRLGSYVLLGELVLTDQVDRYDQPFEGSRCGRCRNCLESCPTGAIVEPMVIDARRCISCRTIEKADGQSAQPALDGWIFGCDGCQSCCPYNRKAPLSADPRFAPVFDPMRLDRQQWLEMDEQRFRQLFGRTPLVRAGLERIRQSLATERSDRS